MAKPTKPQSDKDNSKKDDTSTEKQAAEAKETKTKDSKDKATDKAKAESETTDENQGDGETNGDNEETEPGRGFAFYTMVVFGGIIALCIGLFLFAVLIAVAGGGSGDAAAFVSIMRDLFIIFLAMQGMVISMALIIMVLQLSALMNVLDNEIKPIVQNIQETTSTLRGTAEFVSTNVTRPVIRAHSLVSGTLAVVREITGIRRALRFATEQGEKARETDAKENILDMKPVEADKKSDAASNAPKE